MALSRAHLQLGVEAVDRMGGPLRRVIDAHFGHFCVGAVAPDARERTGTGRAATHFFEFREPSTWGRATAELFVRAARRWRALTTYPTSRRRTWRATWRTWPWTKSSSFSAGSMRGARIEHATVGLTYALERGWDDPSGALARAAGGGAPIRFRPGST